VWVTATNGGEARMGQVWELDVARDRLRLLFESRGPQNLNMPDNLCLSPRGGLAICEDGTDVPTLRGLTREGRIFTFARNACRLAGERNAIWGDYSKRELAGVTYSPDGRWMFFNIQSPGITFAITGPWSDGGL
jgi:secreted PhoX family phosphatase